MGGGLLGGKLLPAMPIGDGQVAESVEVLWQLPLRVVQRLR